MFACFVTPPPQGGLLKITLDFQQKCYPSRSRAPARFLGRDRIPAPGVRQITRDQPGEAQLTPAAFSEVIFE